MFGPDEVLWGSTPGPGPVLRNDIESATTPGNQSSPGFFKVILLSFFILLPIFIIWNLVSPRTLREFSYGPHPIFLPATQPHASHPPVKQSHGVRRRASHVRTAP